MDGRREGRRLQCSRSSAADRPPPRPARPPPAPRACPPRPQATGGTPRVPTLDDRRQPPGPRSEPPPLLSSPRCWGSVFLRRSLPPPRHKYNPSQAAGGTDDASESFAQTEEPRRKDGGKGRSRAVRASSQLTLACRRSPSNGSALERAWWGGRLQREKEAGCSRNVRALLQTCLLTRSGLSLKEQASLPRPVFKLQRLGIQNGLSVV